MDDCVPHNNVCVGCPTAGQETATHYTCNEGHLARAQRYTTCTCHGPKLPLLRPDLAAAVAGMRGVHWVGLTDFFHESMCVHVLVAACCSPSASTATPWPVPCVTDGSGCLGKTSWSDVDTADDPRLTTLTLPAPLDHDVTLHA